MKLRRRKLYCVSTCESVLSDSVDTCTVIICILFLVKSTVREKRDKSTYFIGFNTVYEREIECHLVEYSVVGDSIESGGGFRWSRPRDFIAAT